MKYQANILVLVLALVFVSCSQKQEHDTERSMYYWRTVFALSAQEREFLQEHNISRLYIRFFDVVLNEAGEPMPNATIAFKDFEGERKENTIPENLEVVPTVFITNDCMTARHEDLAEKLFKRVMQMCDTHNIKNVHEIQIDCDWTTSTRKEFFRFLEDVRSLAKKQGIGLSATIRLHQLSQPVPPVDRGVLMVYNTGDVTQLDCHHPILDIADVKQYLPNLKKYGLKLSAAYPLFTWKVLFRNGKYVGIMHSDDDLPVMRTDSIAIRQPDMQHIMEAKNAIDRLREDVHSEIILYDLSERNITLFNNKDYETIFSR